MSPSPASSVAGAGGLAEAWLCWPSTAIGESSRITKIRCLILNLLNRQTVPERLSRNHNVHRLTRNETQKGTRLWRSVFQLHHLRLPFAVNSDDKEIVTL